VARAGFTLLGVTELIGVLVTAAVTLVSTFRWPTLDRRIREHIALLKDMPADLAGPLQALLRREVEELAMRDSRRLHPRENFLLQCRRALLTAVAAAAAVSVAWGIQAGVSEAYAPGWLYGTLTTVLLLGVVALLILVISFLRSHPWNR
jgi:hypothetical protein